MGVGRNEGLRRMHGIDKMDTEGNSQKGKTVNLKGGGLGDRGEVTGVENIMDLYWGWFGIRFQ